MNLATVRTPRNTTGIFKTGFQFSFQKQLFSAGRSRNFLETEKGGFSDSALDRVFGTVMQTALVSP